MLSSLANGHGPVGATSLLKCGIRLTLFLLPVRCKQVQDALFGGSNSFFDFDRIREAIDVITMEDFLATVAAQGLLSKPLPTDVPIKVCFLMRRCGRSYTRACWLQL